MNSTLSRLTAVGAFATALLGSPLASADSGLRVWAQIDGLSRLVIKTNSIHWEHISYTAPGLYNTNLPTRLNGYNWFPNWIQLPGPSRDQAATTLFASNNVPITKLSGRGPVTAIQQPSPANNFTLIVEFDDSIPFYADYYEVILGGVTTAIQPSLEIQVAAVGINWWTASNRLYQVQYSLVAGGTNWSNLGVPIQGNGDKTNVTDSILAQPKKFYRVIPLP